jgi:hypothetical protein
MKKIKAPPIGTKFGRWTVVGNFRPEKRRRYDLECKCECGTQKYVRLHNLLNGRSKACQKCGRNQPKRYVILNGKQTPLITACKIAGVLPSSVHNRVRLNNVPLQEAFDHFKRESEKQSAIIAQRYSNAGKGAGKRGIRTNQ